MAPPGILRTRLVPWLYLAAVLLAPVAFYRPLFSDRIPKYMDPTMQSYPYHTLVWRSLRAGQVPLWNPHLFSGTPFAANPQAGVFYPPRLLLAALLDAPHSFTLLLGIHYVLGSLFTWFWLRAMGLGRSAALLGALVFTLGGQLSLKFALPPVLLAAVWIPAALACLEQVVRSRRALWATGAGASVAMMLLAGYPQIFVTSFVWAPAYLLLRLWPLGLRRRAGAAGVRSRLAWVLRALGLVYAGLFLVWLVSGGLGSTRGALEVSMRNPAKLLVGAFACAAAATIVRSRGLRLRRPRGRLLVVAVTGLLLTGALLPMMQLLPAHRFASQSSQKGDPTEEGVVNALRLPKPTWHRGLWLGGRRNVNQSLFVGVVPLLLFAVAVSGAGRPRAPARALLALAALFFLVAIANPLALWIWRLLPPLRLFPSVWGNLVFVHTAVAGLVGLGLQGLLVRFRRRRQLGVVIALAAVILSSWQLAGTRIRPERFVRAQQFYGEWPSLQALRDDPEPARFVSLGGRVSPTDYRKPICHGLLVPNLALVHGVDDVAGYDPLHLLAYKSFIGIAAGDAPVWHPQGDRYHYVLPNAPDSSRLMDLLNVRHVLRRQRRKREPVRVERNAEALPRAWVVGNWTLAPDADRAARWVHDGLVDPRVTVVLDAEDPDWPSWGLTHAASEPPRIRVFGSNRWLGRYGHLRLGDERVQPVGGGLNLVVMEPSSDRVLEVLSVRDADVEGLERVVRELEQAWPPDTPVALFTAGGFHSEGTHGELVPLRRLGFDEASILRLDQEPLPVAVAALGALGAEQGAARVDVGGIVARVDGRPSEPRPQPFGGEKTGAASVTLAARSDSDLIGGTVACSSPCALVVSEVRAEGWQARLDGNFVPSGRAYGLLHAVAVPPGEHRFELRYRPWSVRAGLVVSLACAAGVLLTLVWSRRRR